MTKRQQGFLLVLFSALCWAVTGNIGAFLFREKGITPEQITTIRLLTTGITLLIYQLIRKRDTFGHLFRTRADVVRALLFGVTGVLFMQYFFYATIEQSNAPTATIIQYTGPFLVILALSIYHRVPPNRKTVVALLMVMTGTYLLITHGDPSTIALSNRALITGALSAVGYAIYNVLPVPLLLRYDTPLVAGVGMVAGGVVLMGVTRPFQGGMPMDWVILGALIFAVIMGTLFPFVAYLEGAKRIGPQNASILASVEPLLSTAVAVLFLNQLFYPLDYAGVVLVVAAVILLSLADQKKEKTVHLGAEVGIEEQND